MKHPCIAASAVILGLSAGAVALAQQQEPEETTFLRSFEGQFRGSGTLERAGGASHALKCSFEGDSEGRRVTLDGSCSAALIFNTSVRIELRYDPSSRRYEGAFREESGTIADLAGRRRGESLSLSFTETAQSVRPGPPATLTIRRKENGITLSLRSSKPGEGQNLDLELSAT